ISKAERAQTRLSAPAAGRRLGQQGQGRAAELRARIEANDIMVFVSNSWRRWNIHLDSKGEERFKGFALRHEVLPIIFVAKERDERDQSFTLMHELAHLILHKADALDGEQSLVALSRENKQEFEANALASYILLSDEARREIDAVQVESKDAHKIGLALDRICKRHRVSSQQRRDRRDARVGRAAEQGKSPQARGGSRRGEENLGDFRAQVRQRGGGCRSEREADHFQGSWLHGCGP
ncbi:MAG: ImmA/IrrE family metallo-endopeptidase, partial [Ectothiorhodospiraceae bacterium AqS1]|nr:ImmA/IrrE family metallo-endopeptidase [Ectothiorhodospiraceae bacterium AqS1]